MAPVACCRASSAAFWAWLSSISGILAVVAELWLRGPVSAPRAVIPAGIMRLAVAGSGER